MENVREAALIDGLLVFGVRSLKELIGHLSGKEMLDAAELTILVDEATTTPTDFSDVRSQERAKRGLLIAAAGGHNCAMYGPPGTGKTMLAKAFAGILPKLTFDEMLEATGIHSAPHHTASYVSLVGGGAIPRPGEITLAHHGVLFILVVPQSMFLGILWDMF
ncbi:MAG: Mg chelatase-related protein [Candidatus Curtissbacteria bacterium GW2011_GWA1_40_16]|uniref:Mg chelatase-related protein n=1 Tax=Candidatus Curtissbacteria bacterium GW2011_GWA1_40_16 TaxID=1618405 RepID=A0A0G0RKA8_9BACT|nr:MAG: Mg chelatase-related protein [Candidatus Curtissbacteria bacterium GW2011_GWA1_40_16]